MIENFCEYVKRIHANPTNKVVDLSVRDFYALRDHIQVCDECSRLVDEVLARYRDVPEDPNLNDGRFN